MKVIKFQFLNFIYNNFVNIVAESTCFALKHDPNLFLVRCRIIRYFIRYNSVALTPSPKAGFTLHDFWRAMLQLGYYMKRRVTSDGRVI